MIQKRDDEKPVHEPFKLRSLMLDLDEYLRIFLLPQLPSGFASLRDTVERVMEQAWREMHLAVFTTKRERQKHLLLLKTELTMVEIYVKEIRDICYRGKEKRKLTKQAERRFAIFADKKRAVMEMVWAWITNENNKLDASTTQKTAGLVDMEEI